MTTTSPSPRRERQTKIVATLGPSSSDPKIIRALFDAGADVFRLNFSHGTHDDHRKRVDIIRAIERETNRPITILADMQGPKLRVGTFADKAIDLKIGQSFRFDLDPAPGSTSRVQLPHPEIFAALKNGSELLCDDGKVRMRVDSCGKDFAEMTVLAGQKLSDRKGVNVPDVVLPLSSLTPKDRIDLSVALDLGADWIALSFVQRPEDIVEARAIIGKRTAILAKLEKPAAVANLSAILDLSDGVMVARGDLGVEMRPEDVPLIQRQILREARRAGKPVIVATQMLESMISAPTPTRAEASDVAAAVFGGADAIMLSAETASGQYPIETVEMMNRIASRVQEDASYTGSLAAMNLPLQHTGADAITAAAKQVAETMDAVAIATYTTSGSTTLRASRERPQIPIICLTSKIETARRLTLSFGVHAVYTKDVTDFGEMVDKAAHIALRDGIAQVGQMIVVTAGVPFGMSGNTNTLRLTVVEK
ncbi:MAG: pyruvate kinase [Alphaproteobacteria bacterium]|nr:pyruvate kinase [Alphaproteobacteria bacterium]